MLHVVIDRSSCSRVQELTYALSVSSVPLHRMMRNKVISKACTLLKEACTHIMKDKTVRFSVFRAKFLCSS